MAMTPPSAPPPSGSGPEGFRPHGRTTAWAEGALVHVVAEGPFNGEAMQAFAAQMAPLYASLPPGRPFVNLTEFRHSMLATPEAWEGLAAYLQQMNASGLPLRATAWIAGPEVEGRALFLPRGEQLFRAAGRRFATFATLTEAEAWARRILEE